jgi:hypothetical protein
MKFIASYKIVLFSLVILIASFVTQMTTVMPSGSHRCLNDQCGIFLWGAHEHDSIWHLALINTGASIMPVYAGAPLTGYNALLDRVLTAIHSLGIDSTLLFFRVIPFLWFIFFVWILRVYAQRTTKNIWYYPCLLFFTFFGGSFSYLLTFIHAHTLIGSSSVLSMQSGLMLTNIQFALSLPLLTYLLILFVKEKQTALDRILVPFVVFTLLGLKFYAGVIAGILVLCNLLLTFKKSDWKTFVVDGAMTGLAAFFALVFFYAIGREKNAGAIFSWTPFATINPIIEEKNLAYLPRLALARYARDSNMWNPVVLGIECITLAIFIVLNFGTRLIGLVAWTRALLHRTMSRIQWLLTTGIIASTLLTLLLSQRGEWWNTIQFVYYAFFFASFFAAETLATWLERSTLPLSLVALFAIIFTIPNSVDTNRLFAHASPTSYIPDQEMSILSILRAEPPGVVLALPIAASPLQTKGGIPPLSQIHDTAYVAAYTGKQTYINDLVQLKLMGIDYQQRYEAVLRADCDVLDHVQYIYLAEQTLPTPYTHCSHDLDLIAGNDNATLYQVK